MRGVSSSRVESTLESAEKSTVKSRKYALPRQCLCTVYTLPCVNLGGDVIETLKQTRLSMVVTITSVDGINSVSSQCIIISSQCIITVYHSSV
jgi:hypothetical protein